MNKSIQGDFHICISVPLTATDNTNYAAYADDISCAGKLRNKLNTFGPKIGYFAKANYS